MVAGLRQDRLHGLDGAVHPGLLHREHRRLRSRNGVRPRCRLARLVSGRHQDRLQPGRGKVGQGGPGQPHLRRRRRRLQSRAAHVRRFRRHSAELVARRKAHRLRASRPGQPGGLLRVLRRCLHRGDGRRRKQRDPAHSRKSVRSFSRVVARWQVDRVRPRSGSVAHGLRGAKRPQDYRGVLTGWPFVVA